MTKKIVEIKGLEYSYPDGTGALCGIDLDVYEGESVGIIGANGAGKSTLLLHLNGILKGKGAVKICGMEVKEENLQKIRGKVGLVFQDPDNQLFMPTVFDDVAFGPINQNETKGQVSTAVDESLRKVGMLGAIDRTSHHLSFGEKKRVSIATVLSMKPEVLVLDEPSSNLDPRSRRSLINLLKSFEFTKIISGHDLSMIAETCSRVAILHKGRIVKIGPADQILPDKALMEAYELEPLPSLSQL